MSAEATLEAVLHGIWQALAAAPADASAPWRFPALATVDAAGAPRLRTLVLRAADRSTATLALHTDARSAKAAEIARDPRVALLFWDSARLVQLRAEGTATLAPDESAFAALPPAARGVYAVAPPPGTPIPAAGAFAHADPAPAFRLLRVAVARLEWLDLSGPRHARARFDMAAAHACWLVP